jgi:hypothetical protein
MLRGTTLFEAASVLALVVRDLVLMAAGTAHNRCTLVRFPAHSVSPEAILAILDVDPEARALMRVAIVHRWIDESAVRHPRQRCRQI